MIKIIHEYIEKLKLKSFDFSASLPFYNPMEEFVNYVNTKEIVHSKILFDLLKEDGNHGLGTVFIDSFLNRFLHIDSNSAYDISVTKERPVKRQLTSGDDRSIDIFIEYKNKVGEKCAIIIENKLNNADYKTLQLEDYYLAIKSEGYKKIDLVCLHEYYDASNNEPILDGVNKKIYYPKDLCDWLYQCIAPIDNPSVNTLFSYFTYLRNLNINNIMLSNTKVLYNLNNDDFNKVKIIAEAYNKLMNDRLPIIKEALIQKWPRLSFKYHHNTSHIEIWDEKMWDENGFEIVVWTHQDYNSLWIVTKNTDNVNKELIQVANYIEDNSYNWNYRWYQASDNRVNKYAYPNKDGINYMINEIERLLNIFHP